ncbi:hypothetical protein GW819_00795 [Candidatus Gracilibacteria bacterium]|nr:hypothetical protein [Candidatus Gracilibacteria bacterium]OIO77437.1 MAG: hypothetical protein AUJ87_01225 [Candidatus Gracilibacteria bacterium CG1_02_38_174]PIQ10855.1 MAG: hypothetical protein COW68_03625 [Candidatus Gracilibacteria bacterium CG18_big_fil_WC_8_21_14_2_50_38_16]PIQ41202.1 MAG: hypothetical protein COW06_03785 [Candidatus Gracilibacteria bacterium CG12_big_fil_rev_8_21_14_0_65_38_15]PIZ01525.1 MAG: hypothetical protein COY60_03040 [Candidatus Gracilibacteria bacterium CG_4
MRQNKKGSILLYVLFLSSFLVLFFVSFQGELEKMLGRARDSEQSIRDQSDKQDTLTLLRNAPTSIKTIDSNSNLTFVSLHQNGTVFSGALGGSGSEEYWITSTGGTNSISLNITQGGPVSYHLAVFNSGFEASSVLISSGIVMTTNTMNLSPSLNTHILVIESLGVNVQYTLDVNAATIIPTMSSYRLERDINGYKKDEGIYDIINFQLKSRAGFDYKKMGMYLK